MENKWHVEYDASTMYLHGKWRPVRGGDKDRTLEEAIGYYQQCKFPSPNSASIYRFHNVATGETIPALILEGL